MGVSGLVGAGGMAALEDLFRQQVLREQMQRQEEAARTAEEQRQIENQRASDAFTFQREQADLTREDRDKARREASNRWGIEDMRQQGADMRTQEQEARRLAGLERIKANPNIPQSVRDAMEAGMSVNVDDFEDPETKKKRALELLESGEQIRAKYRAPREPEEPDQLLASPDGKRKRLVTNREAAPLIEQGWNYVEGGTTGRAGGRGAEGQGAAASAEAIMDEIATLSGKINTGSGLAAKATGAVRTGKAKMNLDNDVAEYNSTVSGFIPMIARAVGHVGVLTEQDVQSVRELFPYPGDSETLAANKLERARRLMRRISGSGGGDDKRTLTDKIMEADIRDTAEGTPGRTGGSRKWKLIP